MTVEQIGSFTAGFYPLGFIERYQSKAAEFQLPLRTKIRDLSKGMKSKVALALATSFEPRLLILDEPTSGLDPVVRRQFLESMIDRAAAGQTVFLSSHQIHEVERVADWIAILHQGKLQVVEEIDQLKRSVIQLSFSLRDPLLPIPTALDDCKIIHQVKSGRSCLLTIRDFDPAIEAKLSESEQVFDIKLIRPSLEDLYIAFTSSGELQPA